MSILQLAALHLLHLMSADPIAAFCVSFSLRYFGSFRQSFSETPSSPFLMLLTNPVVDEAHTTGSGEVTALSPVAQIPNLIFVKLVFKFPFS
jgi:hypothetical protein